MLARYLFVEERVRQGRRVDGRAQVLRQDKFEPGREGTATVVPRRVLPKILTHANDWACEFHVRGSRHIGQSGHALVLGDLDAHAGVTKLSAERVEAGSKWTALGDPHAGRH